MQLKECLQSLFESKDATQNSVSRLSGINKGTLHRIIFGKQDVKFDELMKISGALGLSLGEKNLLFECYFNDFYGEKEMDSVRFAVAEFPKAGAALPVSVPTKGYDTYPDGGFMGNTEKVEEAIVTVTDIESGKIYTNFPFKNERLDEFFFRKAQNKGIELVHFVEKIQKNGEQQNLFSLMRSVRYMSIGQFPYMLDIWQSGAETQLLPYFVVTKKAAVLFNETFGFIAEDGNSVARLTEVVEGMRSSLPRLGKKPADIMEIKNLTAGSSLAGNDLITICKYPCFAQHLTREMMYAAANDVPNKEQLIEICASHYSHLLNGINMYNFVTLPGLEDFAKTGNFYEIPPEFVHGFPVDVRVELLNRMKDDIENDLFYILNRPDAIPDGITLECYSDATLISGTDTSVPHFALGTGFRYAASDPYYIKVTRIIKEFLIAGGYVYSRDSALRIMDNCITLAKSFI